MERQLVLGGDTPFSSEERYAWHVVAFDCQAFSLEESLRCPERFIPQESYRVKVGPAVLVYAGMHRGVGSVW